MFHHVFISAVQDLVLFMCLQKESKSISRTQYKFRKLHWGFRYHHESSKYKEGSYNNIKAETLLQYSFKKKYSSESQTDAKQLLLLSMTFYTKIL